MRNNIFEQAQEFKYLETILISQNYNHEEITIRLNYANWYLYALNNIFKFKLFSRKKKEQLTADENIMKETWIAMMRGKNQGEDREKDGRTVLGKY